MVIIMRSDTVKIVLIFTCLLAVSIPASATFYGDGVMTDIPGDDWSRIGAPQLSVHAGGNWSIENLAPADGVVGIRRVYADMPDSALFRITAKWTDQSSGSNTEITLSRGGSLVEFGFKSGETGLYLNGDHFAAVDPFQWHTYELRATYTTDTVHSILPFYSFWVDGLKIAQGSFIGSNLYYGALFEDYYFQITTFDTIEVSALHWEKLNGIVLQTDYVVANSQGLAAFPFMVRAAYNDSFTLTWTAQYVRRNSSSEEGYVYQYWDSGDGDVCDLARVSMPTTNLLIEKDVGSSGTFWVIFKNGSQPNDSVDVTVFLYDSEGRLADVLGVADEDADDQYTSVDRLDDYSDGIIPDSASDWLDYNRHIEDTKAGSCNLCTIGIALGVILVAVWLYRRWKRKKGGAGPETSEVGSG